MNVLPLRTRRSLALLAGIVVFAASACGAVLPKSPTSDFFVLTALEPAAPPSPPPAAPAVLVGPIALPRYLDRRELVTRLAANQLRVEDLELWAEPIRDSVPATIARDLATLFNDGRVQPLPWTDPAPPDLVVAVDVRRFEKTFRQTVELEAVWTISAGAGGVEHVRRTTRLSLPVAAAGTQAAVIAMSDALARMTREIVRDLRVLTRPEGHAERPRSREPYAAPGGRSP